jgi:hypothetical protein
MERVMNRSTQRFALALIVILIGAGVAAALIFINIPDRNEAILNIALGFILGWGAGAVNYFFGSSDGSDRKTELLNRGPSGKADDPVHVDPM